MRFVTTCRCGAEAAQAICNRQVVGSIPTTGSISFPKDASRLLGLEPFLLGLCWKEKCGGLSGVNEKEKQSILKEFRAFILRGNVVDLAVAVAIGAAFTAVVTSLVAAFITPIIGALFGKDFAHLSFTINDSKFQYGLFVNALITFLITATAVFFFVVKPTQHLLRRLGMAPSDAPEKAPCPRCFSDIPVMASRCAACTSKLEKNWSQSAN